MKILILSRVMPAHGSGGMQQHAANIISYLKDKVDITVLTTAHPDDKEEETFDNVKVLYLSGTVPGKYYGGWWKRSAKSLFSLFEREKYDVILSESVSAYSFYRSKLNHRYNLPVITFSHGTFPKEIKTTLRKKLTLKSPFSFLYKFLMYTAVDRHYYARSSAIVTPSEEIQEYFNRTYPGLNTFLVHNGIDTSMFCPGVKDKNALARYGMNESNTILLSVGRIEKEKGIDDLLMILSQLIAKHPGLRLILAGDGGYKESIIKLSVKLGLEKHIVFAGTLDQNELSVIYRLADAFIFPSRCDEGLPLVILEAMASGLTVVAMKSRGISEIIKHSIDGFIIQPNDVLSLKNTIEDIVTNKEQTALIGKNARKKAEEMFSLQSAGSKVFDIIQLCMAKNNAKPKF